MKYLVALLLAALSLNAVGQTNPNYNPDYDDDGVIGVSDILGVLSTFGETWDSGDTMVIEITPITNDNIHEAVDLWLSDECLATLTYAHISDWDVSSVTSMEGLFCTSKFNKDISNNKKLLSSVIYDKKFLIMLNVFGTTLQNNIFSILSLSNQASSSFFGDKNKNLIFFSSARLRSPSVKIPSKILFLSVIRTIPRDF